MDSGFSELFRQLPPGIPVTFCISAILLVVVVAYIARTRSQRANAALATEGAGMGMGIDMSSADLPDLDSLSSGDAMRMSTPARSGGASRVTLANGEVVEAVEVFSILRDVGEGGLVIRIGDKAYRNPPKGADAEFMRRFQGALRDLAEPPAPNLTPERDTNAMFQPPPPPRPVAPEPEPEPEYEPEPAAVIDELPPAEAEIELDDDDMPSEDLLSADPLPPLRPMPPPMPRPASVEAPRGTFGSVPGDLPKFKLPDGPPVKPKRGQRPVAEPIPEINIAASIEAFLQHRLTLTPEYIGRSIHVRPAAHGGVHIEVDGIFYDSVGEVADDEVRQYLADTIAEWQARQ